jgi:hypothetical protein
MAYDGILWLNNVLKIRKMFAYRGGYGYRSTGHNINGLNINELQINCSIGQQKLVDVWSIIPTNMLLRSTAPHINKYS